MLSTKGNTGRSNSMKNHSRNALVALLALASWSGFAQRHHPPDPAQMVQHRVEFLTQKLGLNAAQQQQATTIFTNAVTAEKASHSQFKAAHDSLQAAVSKNDGAAIDQAASLIANLTAQSISTHAKAEAAFYQTLTPDQQAKYGQMRQHGPGWHGFHHGGPGSHGDHGDHEGPPPPN